MKDSPNSPKGLPERPIDPRVLAMLICPASQQPLTLGDSKLTATVIEGIADGLITTVAGKRFDGSLEGLLVRQDGQVAYPIQDGIPLLLVESGLDLGSLVRDS